MTKEIALKVMQDAVSVLATWAEAKLPDGCEVSEENNAAVKKAKEILSWKDENLGELELIFDYVKLEKNTLKESIHYVPVRAIEGPYPTIPYPVEKNQNLDLSKHQENVKKAVESLTADDWGNLSLLTLIVEKYGWCLSFGEADVALIDMAKSVAGVACAIAHNPEAEKICLVAGDLSGIQKFIYTISSDGALKSLRARSFYLELVAEEIVQQLLERLNLPRTSVIYSGGGNLYLLAAATEETEKAVIEIRSSFNKWLKKEFQEKVFLALDFYCFPAKDVANKEIGKHWNQAIAKVSKQKSRKFIDQISEILTPKKSYEQRCRVCHRDDTEDLEPLKEDNDEVKACKTCRNMFKLGGELFGAKVLVRSAEKERQNSIKPIAFKLDEYQVYYHVFENSKAIVKDADTVLLVNDWNIENYQFKQFKKPVPLLLGNYAKKIEPEENSEEEKSHTMTAEELAEQAKGVNRVGYLRMDVDRLGQIFAKGLGDKHSLTRLAGLSRQMSYFFKTYLNSLAKNRADNLPKEEEKDAKGLKEGEKDAKLLKKGEGDRLVFIYAGGDDLFISGSWNEVVDFAFHIYQAFRAYTGCNPDITLSGGISISGSKFPLYQAAEESGDAESAAKGNGRDSLGLFGEVFKWDEWLGTIKNIDQQIQDYLNPESKPSLWGIIPFVEKLEAVDANYSRSFVRNLLATAQIQSKMIEDIEEERKKKEYENHLKDIRYYLHLPKIAYTLARLPKSVLEDADFRTSLKSPYNAPYFRAIATWIELLNRKTN